MTDAYSPLQIARRVQEMGRTKADSDIISIGLLAALAGAYIALGAIFFAVIITGSTMGFGPTRLLGGMGFALGLILVVVAGAELFTGNILMSMAWASRVITTGDLLRNWLIVYLGNVVGVMGTLFFCYFANIHDLGDGEVGVTLLAIGKAKAALPLHRAILLGILCNALVCLAVWVAMACRSVADRVLAIAFPIAGFVACGFEHSIANWFFLLYAGMIQGYDSAYNMGVASNLIFVTIGNILGGAVLVAAVYWLAYLRKGGGD